MKKVLIISPFFPPSNTADMQRVRMSLSYFKEFGWSAEVAAVKHLHTHVVQDSLLLESLPADLTVHHFEAFDVRWTGKIGVRSVALRSIWYYRKQVNTLLKGKCFQLIFFSTTQYTLCILGAYWKRKFGVPYVIDMQDPWLSDYYKGRARRGRPRKYWFSYRLNKYLEPLALRSAGGIMSVSDAYIEKLKERYPEVWRVPSATITFAACQQDLELVRRHWAQLTAGICLEQDRLNLVYVGRGGEDMAAALSTLFSAFRRGLLERTSLFGRFKFYFIGTSYAPKGAGTPTVVPVAARFGLQEFVVEQTDRVPLYEGFATLMSADGIIVPGSDDPAYNASKIFPYLLLQKPLLAIFHYMSSTSRLIGQSKSGEIIDLDEDPGIAFKKLECFLKSVVQKHKPELDPQVLSAISAREMTGKMCCLFDQVLNCHG